MFLRKLCILVHMWKYVPVRIPPANCRIRRRRRDLQAVGACPAPTARRSAEDELERFLVPNYHLQALQWAFLVECGRFYRIRRISGQSRPIRVPRFERVCLFPERSYRLCIVYMETNVFFFFHFLGRVTLVLWIWDHHGSIRMRIYMCI